MERLTVSVSGGTHANWLKNVRRVTIQASANRLGYSDTARPIGGSPNGAALPAAIMPVAPSLLMCPVRGCGLGLQRHGRALVCRRRHSFDIARSGYVNLLQPNDRRSLDAGDSKEAVGARAKLAATGLSHATTDRIVAIATSLLRGASPGESTEAFTASPGSLPVVVDLGSGTGETLAALARAWPIAGIGIDLSTAAVDYAARRLADLTWVVANADRRVPLANGSADLVLSVHARRNAAECARVLAPHGGLVVAVPAPDDLIELRRAVQGQRPVDAHGRERDRADQVIREHASLFTLVDRVAVREQRRVQRDVLLDLLATTYRGARRSAAQKVRTLDALDLTFATAVLVFERK